MKVRLLCLSLLLLALAAVPASAQNLVVNSGFEEAPYGSFPFNGVYAPTGWTASSVDYWNSYTGVFDSSWKNHNCGYPIWPDPLHNPIDGTHFLAKWLPPQDLVGIFCESQNDHIEAYDGHLRQVVTGLTPGSTYYFSAWFANNNPHGWQTQWGWQYPMFRVGVLPQHYDSSTQALTPTYDPVDPTDTLGVVFSPLQQPNGESWSHYLKKFSGSDETWAKLGGEVTLAADQNAVTLFIEYHTDTNKGYSEAQYVQVDRVRLAPNEEFKAENIQITSFTSTSATIEWDVTNGFEKVTGISGTNCGVKYGATAAYGSYAAATEPNPAACNSDVPGAPGHYKATISGLTTGQVYHFAIQVKSGTYTSMERYFCPGPPANLDPVYHTRPYETYTSADSSFTANPVPVISSVQVSAITNNSATVTWTTDVLSDSRVDFGKFGKLDESASNATLTKSHSVALTNLWSSTTYSFKVTSTGPGLNPGSLAGTPFTTTLGTNIMNGGFEINPTTASKAPYWTDVNMAGGFQLFHNPEWGLMANSGNWYCGMITNFGGPQDKLGVYQQFTTTPGQVISAYAWSWADGHGDDSKGTLAGELHRFGEINNQIGLDPTGSKPTNLNSWPSGIIWGGQLGSTRFSDYLNNKAGKNGQWRRVGVLAIAEGTKATLYLRARSWYANGWLHNIFDDVQLVAPTAVSTVSELKSQPIQTNVNLSGGDYVVTYVCSSNPDANENAGQPYFYIEDADRSAGIKVTVQSRSTWPSWVAVGKKVNIIGTLDWGIFRNYRLNLENSNMRPANMEQQLRMDKPCGELVLRAAKITDAGSSALPAPVAVSNQTLGGGSSADPWFTNAGVAGGSGANNVGLRVRTWGKVTEITTDTQTGYICIVIDDGSSLPPPQAPTSQMPMTSVIQGLQSGPGLFINTFNPSLPTLDDGMTEIQVGDYVMLTGISGVRTDLDPDDINSVWVLPDGSQGLLPEANKNMRAIKIETDGMKFFRM